MDSFADSTFMPHQPAFDQPVGRMRPVPGGPRAYRTRIRVLGPLLGVFAPGVLGGVALLLLRGNTSTVRGAAGLMLSVLAAPGLLVAGVPLTSGAATYALAALGSAVLWFLLGTAAARSATRRPAATWGDFWKAYLWLAGGVWLGVAASLVAANFLLGRPAL